MAQDQIEIDQRVQREYLDFLDDEEDQGIYQQKVRDMITNNLVRLLVNVNDLRRKNPKRALQLVNNAFEESIAFQRALKEIVAAADPVYSKEHDDFFIGLEGSFGNKHVTPRSLTSRYLGNMVCVEGIATKCSLVRPKVVRSVHYCPATTKFIDRKYTDMTSLEAFPTSSTYPTKDEDGNPLETEFGLSTFKDHQTFTIQEMPEKAPAGQLPRSVDIVADCDLVDRCKPGDRVQVVGTFRCLPGKKNGYTSGTFRTVMIANNIQLLNKEAAPTFSSADVAKIKKFSRQKNQDVFEVLAKSLAPSIHGHEFIKKAVLCMLLGGIEKVLDNGSRLRGDINLLLIGDPSVAKSQMLRYVLHTAPRAIATTGRGASGVGLTAAVTTDQETGERRLEAGAMVLADRGVVCIDEFDKMSDIDRTAIHEVMEQGRVTIAKAGIHAKLNARCSVLAAANPVYGRYDQYKTPMENIGLQDSLLSRFDLLFIILDTMDPEHDRMISDHVLRMHRYRKAGEQDGDVLPMGSSVDLLATKDPEVEVEEEEETPIYEKYDALLHGNSRAKKDKIVSMKFMRKYIHIARIMKPKLTREAADYIAEEYSKLRSQDALQNESIARTQPVTARCLETMIRLSTAHAKARLDKTIKLEDAQAAIELVQYAYFKRVLEKDKKRRKRKDDNSTDDNEDEAAEQKKRVKKQRVRRKSGDGDDPYDFDTHDDDTADEGESSLAHKREKQRKKREKTSQDGHTAAEDESMDTSEAPSSQVDPKRLELFKKSLFHAFKSAHAQAISMDQLVTQLEKDTPIEPFKQAEIKDMLNKMQEDNKIMLSDNQIFLI